MNYRIMARPTVVSLPSFAPTLLSLWLVQGWFVFNVIAQDPLRSPDTGRRPGVGKRVLVPDVTNGSNVGVEQVLFLCIRLQFPVNVSAQNANATILKEIACFRTTVSSISLEKLATSLDMIPN